jgi:hypothetical protein
MNHPIRSAASSLALLSSLLAATASSQARVPTVVPPEEAQGMFSTWALGMTVTGSAEPVLIRAPGVADGVPIPWSASAFSAANADHPDYSIAALTAQWSPAPPSTPAFGGIATGGDRMPMVDQDGYLVMGLRWVAVTVAVARGAQGTPGSMVELRRQGRSPSGDILSYYAVGSVEIHDRLVDTVRLESSREQLRLADIANVDTEKLDIANLDYGIGVISADPLNQAGLTFPVRRSFYFTLTRSWIVANPGFTILNSPANAATVYKMQWTNGSWSAPSVAFDDTELFPAEQFPAQFDRSLVEIDGLSVDEGPGGYASPSRVVFSLTPASDLANGGTFDQILVYQRELTGVLQECPTTALKTDAGLEPMLMSTSLGLRPRTSGDFDDVEAVCLIDPFDDDVPGPAHGFALEDERRGKGELGLSVFRTCHGGVNEEGMELDDTLMLEVSGLKTGGFDLEVVCTQLEGPIATPPNSPPGPTQTEAYVIDDIASQRNTLQIPFSVPHALDGGTFRVSFYRYGINFSPYVAVPLAESWVITIGT